jgi:hypothetical protein
MSDCKRFGPTEDYDKSPEERLAEVERLWPIIQGKLQAYDKVLSEFDGVKASFDPLKSSLESQKEELKNFLLSNDKILKEFVTQKFDYLQNQGQYLSIDLDKFKESYSLSIQDIFKRHELLSCLISDASARVSSLQSDVKAKASKDDHKAYVDDKVKTLQDQVVSFSFKADALDERIQQNKIEKIQDDSLRYSLISQMNEKVKHCDDLKKFVEDSLNSISESIQMKHAHLLSQVESSLSQAKSDISNSSDPSKALDVLRSDFMKKVEGMALDTSNALLKSANSSQQILILEKKIENIFLILKKFELSK